MTQHLLDARLLDIGEVADRFGVSIPTIRRAVATRGLPCIKLGARTLRFDWVQITRWAQRKGKWRPPQPAEETVGDAETPPEQTMADLA